MNRVRSKFLGIKISFNASRRRRSRRSEASIVSAGFEKKTFLHAKLQGRI